MACLQPSPGTDSLKYDLVHQCGPSVFHLLSSVMHHVIPSVKVPRKYWAALNLAMIFPYMIHKVSKNGFFEQCIPIFREMKEKHYYKGIGITIWAARMVFMGLECRLYLQRNLRIEELLLGENCYIAYDKNLPTYLHPNHKQYICNLDGKGNEISETYLCYP